MSEYKAKTDWLKKRLDVKYGRLTDKKTDTNAIIQTDIVRSKPQYKGKTKLVKEIADDITAYRRFEANKSRETQSQSPSRSQILKGRVKQSSATRKIIKWLAMNPTKKESPAKKYRRKLKEEMENKDRIKRKYPQVRKMSQKYKDW